MAFAEAFGVYGVPESALWHEGHLVLLWDKIWHDLGAGFKLARVRRLCGRLKIPFEAPLVRFGPSPGEVVLRFYSAASLRSITPA